MEKLSCFLGFIVYCIGYSSSDVTYFGDGCNWTQAMQVCESNGGHLPAVPITPNGFGQINDIRHENGCIWLKATYERTHNLADDNYPNSCCDVMFRDINGTAQKDCFPCKGNIGYICATGTNTISLEYPKNVANDTWCNADKYCVTSAHGLPSDTNTELLHYLSDKRILWIDGVRTLNTNPTKVDGMFPLCFCNGFVRLTCPSKASTYCEIESMSTERFWTSYFTSPLSSSLNVSKTSTRILQDATSFDTTQTTRADVRENGALIGGVAGAGVVLTMIIIIVVVFLLRRSKQKQNKNSNSPSHVNHDNLLKAKIHANPSYHDVNGEVLNTVTHESVQMQHMEKESITYATITKVPGSSDIARDNFNCITTNEEQSMTDVYSMVHKRPNTGQNLHPMNQNEVGDEKYDKINFDKSYQPKHAELAGDVYDKTNFCCEDRGDISENVYNKAEFYHKHQSVDDWNIYDKPNFDGGQQNKQNENLHTNQKGASPGQRSKDFYAKAYFHRMPQDKCSDDEYDRIKLQL